MIRGTLVLLDPEKMFVTQEINGDMDIHFEDQSKSMGRVFKSTSRGAKALKMLEKVKSKSDLNELLEELDPYTRDFLENNDIDLIREFDDKKIIKKMLSFDKFNEKIKCKKEDGTEFQMSWYYYNWSSDYLFIKNNMGKTINLIDKNKQVREVKNQEIVVLKFGEFEDVDII